MTELKMNTSPQSFADPATPLPNLDRPIPRLIKMEEVCKIIGFQKSMIYKYSAEGIFPRPIKLGTSRRGAVRWFLSEVLDFVEKLARDRFSAEAPASIPHLITPAPVPSAISSRPHLLPLKRRT